MTEERNPLEVLLDEFVERRRRGDDATVEEYAERHPDLADDIRDLFPAAAAMERARSDISESRPAGPVVGPGADTDLGDYHLIEEIGHGGMGVVYEAEQRSLGRRVALKVLPRAAMRDERRIQRFRNEAQTAARLHHTNIVPIFGVGESDGYHFYVMQFIRGIGLDLVLAELFEPSDDDLQRPRVEHADVQPPEAVRGLHTGRFIRATHEAGSRQDPAARSDHELDTGSRYWRSVADIGLQVADALCYAHEQGTLHRDIKPANLLLDGDGVAWVTDFGLARAIEGDGMTMTGDVVGTLQYMSPEQLRGKYDARSDVYGLGLTLYELATHQPAFAGSERSGLVDKIQKGGPTQPRKLQPGIPVDLETIVMKAIETEPDHRYASAAELRRDLELFLEDRPIRARRVSSLEHGWRWCRRNRLVASLAAVALLAVLATAATGWSLAVMRSSLLNERNVALADAEQNLNDGLGVIEDIFDRIAGRDPFGYSDDDADTTESETDSLASFYTERTVSEADAALLQDLLRFYDRFAERNADNEALQADSARAYHRVGLIHARLGRQTDAEAAFQRALSRFGETKDPQKYRLERARVHNDRGLVMRQRFDRRGGRGARGGGRGRPDGGDRRDRQRRDLEQRRAQHERAFELLANAATPAERLELARTHQLLGESYRPERRRGPGRSRRPESERDPERDSRQKLRAEHLERALDLCEALLAEDPSHPPYREAVARSCRQMASLERSRQNDDAAVTMDTRARQLLDELNAEYPGNASYKAELADMLQRGLRRDDADVERAWSLALELVDEHPSSRRYSSDLRTMLFNLVRRRRGPEPEERLPVAKVIELCSHGIERLERSAFGADGFGAFQLVELRLHLAQLYLRDEVAMPALALPLLQRSIDELQSQQPTDVGNENENANASRFIEGYRRMRDATLGHHYRLLAGALRKVGDEDGATTAESEAAKYPEREREGGRGR